MYYITSTHSCTHTHTDIVHIIQIMNGYEYECDGRPTDIFVR